ncbi:MAG: LPS export ABC transporter periplasmic protein LptC [Arcobacter sp.]|nr:LPS export ABC transporter periplasmic protein LptC [Arcobacter sp.]
MGINVFLGVLLLLSLIFNFIPIEKNNIEKNEKDIPLVIFENPQMYTINEKYVTRVAKAKEARRYKTKDEFENTHITLRNLNKKKDYELESLKASKVIKRGKLLELRKDVKYKRDDFISFKTDELYYDLKEKMAYNTVSFEGRYDNHLIKGKNLFLDSKESKIKSKNIHFEFDLKNKGKK